MKKVKSVVEVDLDRIQQAWHDASDADVIRALLNIDDYPQSVFTLIRDEALRRGIDADQPVLPVSPPSPLAKIGASVRGWICRHRMLSAVGLGILVRLGMLPMRRVADPIIGTVLSLVYLIVLVAGAGALCWPLRVYRIAVFVTLAAFVGLTVPHLDHLYASYVRFGSQSPAFLLMTNFVMVTAGFAVPCLLLLATVFVRRRYWPVYPPGYCGKCGYDLRYLPLPRCPECGTPFDPAALPESGDGEASTS